MRFPSHEKMMFIKHLFPVPAIFSEKWTVVFVSHCIKGMSYIGTVEAEIETAELAIAPFGRQ